MSYPEILFQIQMILDPCRLFRMSATLSPRPLVKQILMY